MIFLLLWLIFCLSITLSQGLMSISLAAIAFIGILEFKTINLNKKEKILSLLFLAFYLITALTFFNSNNSSEALRKLVLKLPILLFPLILIAFKSVASLKSELIGIVLFGVYFPAIVSVYNYFSNKTLFDQLILESKPLPIEFGYGIYHIQFSIVLASTILIGFYYLLANYKKTKNNISYYTIGALTFINFLSLHILSARTGLLACYTGIIVIVYTWLRKANTSLFKYAVIAMIVLPFLAYFSSKSLQNRVTNTIADLKVVMQKSDPNDYSFAMRVEAWKNASNLISKYPIAGVGVGDADSALFNNFELVNPKIVKENRKNPHFQLLESGVQSGVFSMLFYLSIILFGVAMSIKKQPLVSAIIVLMFIASCFESILESQASVAAFCLFIPLAFCVSKND